MYVNIYDIIGWDDIFGPLSFRGRSILIVGVCSLDGFSLSF